MRGTSTTSTSSIRLLVADGAGPWSEVGGDLTSLHHYPGRGVLPGSRPGATTKVMSLAHICRPTGPAALEVEVRSGPYGDGPASLRSLSGRPQRTHRGPAE